MFAMGQVLPYRPPQEREQNTAYLGMVIFLASWAMMFAALFFAYAFARSKAQAWPPPGLPALPLSWPALNTAALALSSVAMQWGIFSTRRGRVERLWPALALTTLLGAVFLGLQAHLWTSLYAQGLRPDNGGTYASVFYGLTWFHALHVAVGVLGLSRVTWKALRGAYTPAKFLPVRLWAMYWHFVGMVWALMFVSIFWL